MNNSKFANYCTALIAVVAALNAGAADKIDANPYLGALSTTTSVELPGKVAQLVSQTEANSRKQATIDVVKSAVGLNPAAAPLIVGSIAQAVPDMAATAAGTAVSLVPDQAVTIARVAAAAAPTKAGQIVEAICRLLPKQYKAVAMAVAEVVPSQSKEILMAVSTAIPTLIIPAYTSNSSVETVLDEAKPSDQPTAITVAAVPHAGPNPLPPYVPLPPSHGNIDPGSGGDVPGGGRDYSAP